MVADGRVHANRHRAHEARNICEMTRLRWFIRWLKPPVYDPGHGPVGTQWACRASAATRVSMSSLATLA